MSESGIFGEVSVQYSPWFDSRWFCPGLNGQKDIYLFILNMCLGSKSVGSARFWFGSGSAKIFRSTDPDPRGKIYTKTAKK